MRIYICHKTNHQVRRRTIFQINNSQDDSFLVREPQTLPTTCLIYINVLTHNYYPKAKTIFNREDKTQKVIMSIISGGNRTHTCCAFLSIKQFLFVSTKSSIEKKPQHNGTSLLQFHHSHPSFFFLHFPNSLHNPK